MGAAAVSLKHRAKSFDYYSDSKSSASPASMKAGSNHGRDDPDVLLAVDDVDRSLIRRTLTDDSPWARVCRSLGIAHTVKKFRRVARGER